MDLESARRLYSLISMKTMLQVNPALFRIEIKIHKNHHDLNKINS